MHRLDGHALLCIGKYLGTSRDLVNLASCCRAFHSLFEERLAAVARRLHSPLQDLLELMFALSMRRLADRRLPEFVPPAPRNHHPYAELLLRAWRAAPPRLLFESDALVDWSRTAYPGVFASLLKFDADLVSDASGLFVDHPDGASAEYSFARFFSDSRCILRLLDGEVVVSFEQRRRARKASRINEAAIARQMMTQLEACLRQGTPLGIAICELDGGRAVPVAPSIVSRPKFNRARARLAIRARFADEPEEQDLIFEWRPEKAAFRSCRRPGQFRREYTMRLTPLAYAVK